MSKDLAGYQGGGKDDWETPPELFQPLAIRFGFTLDVCATEKTAKCPLFFTPEDNGLEQPWGRNIVWCNPPYSSWGDWAAKAEQEARKGAVVVMLIPPRTDSKAWHKFSISASACVFLQGRVSFLENKIPKPGNPAPSVLLVWDYHLRKLEVLEKLGNSGPPSIYWDWKGKP